MTEQKDKRGGARKGAGRKAEDGASGLVGYTIKLSPALKARCMAAGSAAVRKILDDAVPGAGADSENGNS